MPTYRIPDSNLQAFKVEMGKLIRRAEKIGVAPPTYTVGAMVEVEADDHHVITAWLVTVEGEAPKFDGWGFIAYIDIDREVGPPHVVNAIEGVEVDELWRTAADYCDHCETRNRGRKSLVVVEHENGDRKIVGSTCLHDFLGGNSPQKIAAWAEILATLDDRLGGFEHGGTAEWRCDPVIYLGWVIRSIADYRWVPRSSYSDRPTADDAAELMAGKSHPRPEPLVEAELTEAARVLAWGAELTGTKNDYLDNLGIVANKDSWRSRDLGLAASMVQAYRRDHGQKLAAAQTPKPESQHVGTVGEDIELKAEVTFARVFDGQWGPRTMVKLEDELGNVYVWGVTEAQARRCYHDLDKGVLVEATVKVKEHDLYGGIKQTVITAVRGKAIITKELP